ncbi:MAG: LamG domain-containing protein [Caldilineales bacterium]|nr:LamG domain-containing protein [Caldilineales bacterium]
MTILLVGLTSVGLGAQSIVQAARPLPHALQVDSRSRADTHAIAARAAPHTTYSLRFYGHGVSDIDRVKIPIDNPQVPADIGAGDFTIEFWMKAAAANNTSGPCTGGGDNWTNGNIIVDRDIFGAGDYGDFGVSLYGGRIAFGVANSSTSQTVCSATSVANNTWRHIALTRNASTGQIRIFVDGVLDATATGPTGDLSYRNGRSTSWPNDPFLVLGAEKHDYNPSTYPSYNGFLDELRLSTVIRYSGNFTPPAAPFTPDAQTAALYHFDEGPAGLCANNQTIVDSSGAPGGPSHGVCKPGGSGTPGPVYSTDIPFTPSAVALADLAAEGTADGVVVTWETVSEVENVGFHLDRAETPTGPWRRLNAAPIPSAAPGAGRGAVYRWTDREVAAGVTYWYRVTAVDVHGQEEVVGVVSATAGGPERVRRLFLPLVTQ